MTDNFEFQIAFRSEDQTQKMEKYKIFFLFRISKKKKKIKQFIFELVT